jgi:hypothetical protein
MNVFLTNFSGFEGQLVVLRRFEVVQGPSLLLFFLRRRSARLVAAVLIVLH